MSEQSVIRINDQGAKYDVKSMVLQSPAYPNSAFDYNDLIENKQGVIIDALVVKPVVVVHEGRPILLIANKSLEAIKADRLKTGKEKIVCKLANKYVLKKAMIIDPPPRPVYQERRDFRPYQAPQHYSNNSAPARNYRQEYDY